MENLENTAHDLSSFGEFGSKLSVLTEKFVKEAKGLADEYETELDVVIRFGLADSSNKQGE